MAQPDFDAVMAALDAPMLIVTAREGDERAGCLVGFAAQVSIDPPRFLACLSVRNRTFRVAERAARLAVHVVPAHATALAELFGGETGDEVDKFARCDWDDGPHGLPVLRDCESWFAGRVVERVAFGDHVGFLLDPEVAERHGESEPLGTQRAARIEPGHDA